MPAAPARSAPTRSAPAKAAGTRSAAAKSGTAPQDPISQFFAVLAAPGHLETFADRSASVRFDVRDGAAIDPWQLTVTKGDVTVAHQGGTLQAARPDAIVRIDRPYFESIVTGHLNAQAAILRGLLTCEGSMAALIMFQRCLPGPPGSKGRVAPISSQTVMAQRRPK